MSSEGRCFVKRMVFVVDFLVDHVTTEGAEMLVSKALLKMSTGKVNVIGFQNAEEPSTDPAVDSVTE